MQFDLYLYVYFGVYIDKKSRQIAIKLNKLYFDYNFIGEISQNVNYKYNILWNTIEKKKNEQKSCNSQINLIFSLFKIE